MPIHTLTENAWARESGDPDPTTVVGYGTVQMGVDSVRVESVQVPKRQNTKI